MTRLLHRSIPHTYPVAETAEGMIIRDSTGKDYIDASGGAAVSCLGHGHPDVLAAMHAQLDKLAGRIEGLAALFDPNQPVCVAVFSGESEAFAMQRHRELRPEHAGRCVRFNYRRNERSEVHELTAVWAGATEEDFADFQKLLGEISGASRSLFGFDTEEN